MKQETVGNVDHNESKQSIQFVNNILQTKSNNVKGIHEMLVAGHLHQVEEQNRARIDQVILTFYAISPNDDSNFKEWLQNP